MEHAIVGFDLLRDPVLGGEFIPFEEGLNVFYGLNGAGKTRLLTGIKNSMLGIASEIRVGLVVRVHEPTLFDVESDGALPRYLGEFQRCSGAGLLLALANAIGQPYEDRAIHERTLSLQTAFKIVREHLRAELQPLLPSQPVEITTDELEREVLNDRLFLLVSKGTSVAPLWEAWPVADRRHPVIQKWEKRWADSQDESLSQEEAVELQDRLQNVGLDETGAIGWDTFEGESFDGYYIGHSRSKSFVLVSNYIDEGGVPFILRGAIDFGIDVVATDMDPNTATLDLLAETAIFATSRTLGDHLDVLPPESSRYMMERMDLIGEFDADQVAAADVASSTATHQLATELAQQVNMMMSSVLMDPPVASIRFVPTMFRFSAPTALWTFQNDANPWEMVLTELSAAEERWAKLAINCAIAELRRQTRFQGSAPLRRTILVIDEPEAALHRAAEARAADFLRAWTRDPRHVAFVATHSPELLDLPDSLLTEISKQTDGTSKSQVERLDLADRDALQRLGLRPSDRLQLTRVFLLVEGEHDKQMIDAYFGPRLRQARIKLLPMRGAKQLASTIDSRLLFDFSDAPVVALLDNLSAASVSETWAQAQRARELDGVAAAKQIIVDWFADHKSEESRYMSGWLTSALEVGLESRLTPYGLSAKDVIEYLPVSVMVPGATSWEALHEEHQVDRALNSGHPKEFKPWLKARKGVEVTAGLIQSALETAPEPPPDMERLMKTLEAVSAEVRETRSDS